MSDLEKEPIVSDAPAGVTRSLLKILAGERWRYGVAFGVLVVGIVVDFLAPFLSQAVIDAVANAVDGGSSRPAAWITVVLGGHGWVLAHMGHCMALMVGLVAVGAVASLISGRQIALGSERSMARLRTRLFDHIQRLPLRYHDSHETGELVQRCTSDVETIRRFLSTNLVQVWRSVVMVAPMIAWPPTVKPIRCLYRCSTRLHLDRWRISNNRPMRLNQCAKTVQHDPATTP